MTNPSREQSNKTNHDYNCDDLGFLEAYKESQSMGDPAKVEEAIDFCLKKWSYSPIDIAPEELSAREAVTLISLVHCCGWIGDRILNPIAGSESRFAPNYGGYPESLVADLVESEIISPAPEVWLEEATENNPPEIGQLFTRTRWILRPSNAKEFIRKLQILSFSFQKPAHWLLEKKQLSSELALTECQEFFVHLSNLHQFGSPSPLSLELLIKDLLKYYSVSQCLTIILIGSRDTLTRREVENDRNFNTVEYMAAACRNYADQARKSNEEITGLTRPSALGRSQISFAIHDLIYGGGELNAFYSRLRT